MEEWEKACTCIVFDSKCSTFMRSDVFHILLYVFRVMGRATTMTQKFTRAAGWRTSGAAGELCTTTVEMCMRGSGWTIRHMDRAAFDMVRELSFKSQKNLN